MRGKDTFTRTIQATGLHWLSAGIRRALLTGVLSVAALLTLAPAAFAAYSHNVVEGEFSLGGPPCVEAQDIAVLEDEELIYVSCRTEATFYAGLTSYVDIVKRFKYDGEPVDFTAVGPYIDNHELTNDPGSFSELFIWKADLAVDNSNTFNHGNVYITSAQHLDVFRPSGEFLQSIYQLTEHTTYPNTLEGVDVGEDGYIYLTSDNPASRVSKYDLGFREVKRLYKDPGPKDSTQFHHIRVDSTGSLWAGWETNCCGGTQHLEKFEADQFTDELEPSAFQIPANGLDPFYADPSPFIDSSVLSFPSPGYTRLPRFDVDLTDDDLYVDRRDHIAIFSSGNAEEATYQNAPSFGAAVLNESKAIAVTKDHKVFASTETPEGPKIVRFGPGDIVPDVHTDKPQLEDIGHTEVEVNGEVDPAGGSNIIKCEIEYGLTKTYSATPVPCMPDPAESPPASHFTGPTQVSAELTGLTTGATYHYRIHVENEEGENWGIDRVVTPAYVLHVRTLPATDIDPNGATLNASFDPDGLETSYRFEYGPTTGYDFETPEVVGGSGFGDISVGSSVGSLPSGRIFHYRVIGSNENGTTVGPDMTFRTSSPPDVEGVRASDIEPTSALLHAAINPVGYDTKYHFEYGKTPEYGQRVPAGSVDIGAGKEQVDVTQKLEGLQTGVTYHFRVVAENEWGTAASDDTTFDYAPPGCPNDYQRQLTLGSYLPDCRAYELVSPGEAGAVLLFPSITMMDNVQKFWAYSPCCDSSPPLVYSNNRGLATAPARFVFGGGYGAIKGLDPPVRTQDQYMATRTTSGWVTTLPGLKASETADSGRKECTDSLSICTDHSEMDTWGFEESFAPYMFTAEGKYLGRLPTNLGVIPGGKDWKGGQRLSGNGEHFVFSSQEYPRNGFGPPYPALAFAPGGVTEPFGSAYDNDIGERTVTIISRLPNGDKIAEDTPRPSFGWKAFDFPGMSRDGSHVLMSTYAGGGTIVGGELVHLFMRVNQAMTYDVSRGAAVEFVGMTRDGSKVMYITEAKLTGDDTDESKDLYLWEEDGSPTGSLTRISQGNGHGDSDECNPSWSPGDCSVVRVTPQFWHPNNNQLLSAPGQDDIIAEGSGDVYFYSPEVLDGTRQGLINERNLYVYRNGTVRLVAALSPDDPVKRMQISPDGGHAALLTASRLTPYDNKEFDQIYAYNAETRVIRCASCLPTGRPPTEDAYASMSGRFMADDGRTFFATADSLVPRDQNGNKIDVYEYVGGRPQLITTGLASRDFTGGGQVQSLINPPVSDIGLESVSRDGVDVIFSTFETILPEDRNGQFIKFYDARTGGGIPRDVQLAPCVAADECHGVDSSRPTPSTISSETQLGAGGNAGQRAKLRRCGKGKVRRGKRCLSKRALRKHHRKRKRRRHGARAHRNGRRSK